MALQCFTKQFLRFSTRNYPIQVIVPSRKSSYISSKLVGPLTQYTDVEVSKNPEEWKFVERLIAPKYIPVPKVQETYASGWIPMKASSALDYPYFVNRTKNHMPPIYMEVQVRGMKRMTVVKNIQGDIWALEKDLKDYLTANLKGPFASRVNEVTGRVHVRGDKVTLITQWFHEKGF